MAQVTMRIRQALRAQLSLTRQTFVVPTALSNSAAHLPARCLCTQKLTKVKKPKRRTVSVKVKYGAPVDPHAELGHFTVALLGRPNVGKSTLFNRLRSDGGAAGRGRAVTHRTPGTTRDWRDAPAWLAGLSFRLLDTGGVEHLTGHARRSRGGDSHITQRMRSLTAAALTQADNILFMVSARDGITPEDEAVARWLRSVAAQADADAAANGNGSDNRQSFLSRVTVVANKAENLLHSASLSAQFPHFSTTPGAPITGFSSGTITGGESGKQVLQFSHSHDTEGALDWMSLEAEVARLGLGLPLPLSAAHGDGLTGLVETLLPTAQASASAPQETQHQRSVRIQSFPPAGSMLREPLPASAAAAALDNFSPPTLPKPETPAQPKTTVTLGGGQQGMLHTPRIPTGMGMELGPLRRPVKGATPTAPPPSPHEGGVDPSEPSRKARKETDKRSADGTGPVPRDLRVPEAGDRHRGLERGLLGQGGFGGSASRKAPLDESTVEGAVEAGKRRQAAAERAVLQRMQRGGEEEECPPGAARSQLGTQGRVSRRLGRAASADSTPTKGISEATVQGTEVLQADDAQVSEGPLDEVQGGGADGSELAPDGSTLAEWLKQFKQRREQQAASGAGARETVSGEHVGSFEGGGEEAWDPLENGIQVEGQVLSSRPDEEFRLAATPHAHWGKGVVVTGDHRVTSLRDTLPDGSVGHRVRLGAHGEVTVSPKGAVLDSRGGVIVGESTPSKSGVKRAERHAMKDRAATVISIFGRPNVGKSTLMNKLLGQERVLTGPFAGVTRDPIHVPFSWHGEPFTLIDTAGMRRWGQVDTRTPLEPQSVCAAQHALALSHVALLVVDGELGVSSQDVQLAQDALAEGRPLVVALNKSDIVPDRALAKAGASAKFAEALAGTTQGVEVVPISAVSGAGLSGLLPAISRAYDRWSVRVPTGYLNRWLRRTCRTQPPPSAFKQVAIRGGSRGGRGGPVIPVPLKLKYLSQVNTRPPTFTLFANREDVPESYRRYLLNSLRSEFSLFGVPLRMMVRAASNPYAKGRNDSRRLAPQRSASTVKRIKAKRLDKKSKARKGQ